MGNIEPLIHIMGPFILVPILFLVVGIGSWLNTVWGLITGGPRALQEPGAPYLFDRLYYFLFGIGLFGWSFALLSFASLAHARTDPQTGFMTGWGISAIGMGLMLLLRGDMVIHAARYRAEHGFWLFRIFYRSNARNFERWNPVVRKLFAGGFIAAGTVVTIFCLPHMPEALAEVRSGIGALVDIISHP